MSKNVCMSACGKIFVRWGTVYAEILVHLPDGVKIINSTVYDVIMEDCWSWRPLNLISSESVACNFKIWKAVASDSIGVRASTV